MRIAKITLVILFLLNFLIPPQTVSADMAPPPAVKLGGLEPFEYQSTEVQMVYERVEMELRPSHSQQAMSEWGYRIFVSAYFLMHNQGTKDESMEAIFPLSDLSCGIYGSGVSYTTYQIMDDSFSISVDGSLVAVKKRVTAHPRKIPDICEMAEWAAFDVPCPAGKDVLVRIGYEMEATGDDDFQNVEYILETGAGWKGPIGRGYVIMKFPYEVGQQNVLESGTTPGYQTLYNEIFWSFEGLEPTAENNIRISFVGPLSWQTVRSLQQSLAENPKNPSAWIKLAEMYQAIAFWHGTELRSEYYAGRIESVYQQGVAENPNSADLYARYAAYKLFTWSPHYFEPITADQARQVISLLNKALALEPDNQDALFILSALQSVAPFVTFTPPPTIPLTVEPPKTETPSVTPTITLTSPPSAKRTVVTSVVTVVHTKIVAASTSTPEPTPTVTLTRSPTPTTMPVEEGKKPNTVKFIFGGLIIFVVGIGAGVFLSNRLVR